MREYNSVSWEGGEGDPADFETWGRMPFWTSEEAAELSEGLEPGSTGHLREGNLILVRIIRRQKHIERAIAVGQLPGKPGRISPRDFVKWAYEQSIELPRALRSVVHRSQEEPTGSMEAATVIEQCGNEGDDASLPTRARNTLFRMILGMAIEKYRYRPNDRSGAAKRISDDLHSRDLPVSDDTVRKWLEAAVRELDFNLSKIE
jgi:hypothetical protein